MQRKKTNTPAKGRETPVKVKGKSAQVTKRCVNKTAKKVNTVTHSTSDNSKRIQDVKSNRKAKQVAVKPRKQTAAEHKTAEAVRLAMKLAPQCVALYELPGAMYREAQKFGVTDCKLSFDYCQKTVHALQAAGRLK